MSNRSTIKIKPFSGATMGLVSRLFFLIFGGGLGGLFIRQAFTEPMSIVNRCCVCFVIFSIGSAILVLCIFNYTELNENRIVTVFRIGRFIRWELSSVNWDEVRHAEFTIDGTTSRTASLRLSKFKGKDSVFIASPYGRLAHEFDSISHQFPRRAP